MSEYSEFLRNNLKSLRVACGFTQNVVAAALGCRCGSCFHVVWNQEREAAGLDQKMS